MLANIFIALCNLRGLVQAFSTKLHMSTFGNEAPLYFITGAVVTNETISLIFWLVMKVLNNALYADNVKRCGSCFIIPSNNDCALLQSFPQFFIVSAGVTWCLSTAFRGSFPLDDVTIIILNNEIFIGCLSRVQKLATTSYSRGSLPLLACTGSGCHFFLLFWRRRRVILRYSPRVVLLLVNAVKTTLNINCQTTLFS
jgi:hypothetical protein